MDTPFGSQKLGSRDSSAVERSAQTEREPGSILSEMGRIERIRIVVAQFRGNLSVQPALAL
jgi:hypothetical protein